MVGSRPSQGELQDLLRGKLLAEVGKISDVQILGRGFYQIEFEEQESAIKVVGMSPLLVRGASVHFRSWFHGFDPATETASAFVPVAKRGFPVTARFPGLRREYLPLLPRMWAGLGNLF